MKTFQISGRPEIIGFTNYDRISEDELFQQIFKKLEGMSEVEIGSRQMGPSEDFYECSFMGEPFTLYHDMDNGSSIYCDSPDVISKLIKLLDTTIG